MPAGTLPQTRSERARLPQRGTQTPSRQRAAHSMAVVTVATKNLRGCRQLVTLSHGGTWTTP